MSRFDLEAIIARAERAAADRAPVPMNPAVVIGLCKEIQKLESVADGIVLTPEERGKILAARWVRTEDALRAAEFAGAETLSP